MWNVSGKVSNPMSYVRPSLILVLCSFATTGCLQLESFEPLGGSGNSQGTLGISVSNVDVSNNILTIQGSGLNAATGIQIQGVGDFTILSQSATQLQAAASVSL